MHRRGPCDGIRFKMVVTIIHGFPRLSTHTNGFSTATAELPRFPVFSGCLVRLMA